ncbi:DUF4124 domain-containing protein [Kineococcus sp. TBRC 1896]|uniref:DUF4124 domain-containing protein n=1 Tax=Kineococcus mangrovi TaxID=1660183 RepID=A0ABV4HXW0_9ACTN
MSEQRTPTARKSARPRWIAAGGVVVVLALVVVALLVHGGGSPTPGPTERNDDVALPADYPFSAESVWRQDISDAPVADNSAAQVAEIAEQVESRHDGVAAFNVNRFQVSFYTVGPDQPRVDVDWDDCQKKGYTPKGLLGEDGQFTDVPIPDDAVPAAGTDGQLTIYSPETDQLWEFWKAEKTDSGTWQACWGGRMDDVSRSPGYFDGGFGSSGTGLGLAGGMVWVDDARSGTIDHALSLQLTAARHWKTFSWPAQRSDGNDRDEDAVQEGTRLRLDPDVDVDQLGLTPLAAMIARAAQKYGFIVTDRAGSVAITAESGQELAQDNPWPALMGDAKSYEVMAGFPWEDLQALPRNYGKPSRSASPSAGG